MASPRRFDTSLRSPLSDSNNPRIVVPNRRGQANLPDLEETDRTLQIYREEYKTDSLRCCGIHPVDSTVKHNDHPFAQGEEIPQPWFLLEQIKVLVTSEFDDSLRQC